MIARTEHRANIYKEGLRHDEPETDIQNEHESNKAKEVIPSLRNHKVIGNSMHKFGVTEDVNWSRDPRYS